MLIPNGRGKMTIEPVVIVAVCCSDITGQIPGQGVRARDLESRRRFGADRPFPSGVTNCFGRISAPALVLVDDLLFAPSMQSP